MDEGCIDDEDEDVMTPSLDVFVSIRDQRHINHPFSFLSSTIDQEKKLRSSSISSTSYTNLNFTDRTKMDEKYFVVNL
jgi:hypothetical protein